MDPMDWRLSLLGRYLRAIERGDMRELERILCPNFHEDVEEFGEMARSDYLDHMQNLMKTTRYRSIQLLDARSEEDKVCTQCVMRFYSEAKDWIVHLDMEVRMNDGLVERVSITGFDLKTWEPSSALGRQFGPTLTSGEEGDDRRSDVPGPEEAGQT